MASIAADLAKYKSSALGVGTQKNPVKYLNQDFGALRTQCLASGTLFEDPEFPASQSSLGANELGPNSEDVQGLVWKRPAEIKPNPQFITEGANRADVRQGSLGDCWFLSSVACLTLNEDCLYRVLPIDQSFDTNYAGIFHFKFWQYGEWVDVVVDDRLPTKKGKLLFVKSTTANEFWSALLEKAYAKLYGSYEALKSGSPLEALEDFTGGIGELFVLKEAPENLFQIIQKTLRERSFVSCSTVSVPGVGEIVLSNNLVTSHAYSVTGAEEVAYLGKPIQIIRVRNPWGFKEWNGSWSDNAPEWNGVDPEVRAKLNIQSEDGEAWFPFSSFLAEFYQVQICHLSPDYACSDGKHNWYLTEMTGKWTAGSTAGGCVENPMYWTNPQFQVTVEDPDDGHAGDAAATGCTIVVSLMQKGRRTKKNEGQLYFLIGFDIYSIPKETPISSQMGKNFFMNNNTVACTEAYRNHREVSDHFRLPVGKYLIVPTTYKPDVESDFFLRVFTEKKSTALELGNVVKTNIFEILATSCSCTKHNHKQLLRIARTFCIPPTVPCLAGQPCFSDTVLLPRLWPPLPNSAPGTESPDEFEDPEEELNVEDLQSALTQRLLKRPDVKSNGFTLRTCREMINLLDRDNTGTLSKEEFKVLWMKLENYTKIFLEVDTNLTGTIDAHEMRNALQKAGFTLNTRIQDVIARRYATKELSIHFEDFITCMMRLETLLKMFNILDTNKSGNINLSVSEWLCAGLI
ncbi:calpain-8-like [Pseudophryne corroboree]|uniref:calpain-8-like n=1 Tax=Pseudophryne corroboree TaxID=495146 RepID=UPI00308146CE